MSQFQTQRGREFVSTKPGAPEQDRTRGTADIRKGSSKHKTTNDKPSQKRSRPKNDVSTHSSNKPSKRQQEPKGYEGDDAQRHLKKFGAKEGWLVECYPKDKYSTERWFMRVENGLTVTDDQGDILIRKCRWLESNSVTTLCSSGIWATPDTCDIESVKAYGPPDFFNDVVSIEKPSCGGGSGGGRGGGSSSGGGGPARKEAKQSTQAGSQSKAGAAALMPSVPVTWVKGTIGWGVPGSAGFTLKKKATDVQLVTFPDLHKAMKSARVPGAAEASNKDTLIELMCFYNCEFVALPHPSIVLGKLQRVASSQSRPTPVQTQDKESSSSDPDAPISRGAKRLAREMAAAAAAAKKPKVTQQQVLAAVQRISARTKPQVSEECQGDAYCTCPKCL
jgi:hypothetical protein